MNWKEQAATSHYQTAVAIQQALMAKNIEEAEYGIGELAEALGRSDKRALRSQLTRLMAHIIKWHIQPERRSRSWLASISNARIEIEGILEDEPSQKRNLLQLWEKSFRDAKKLARDETGIEPKISGLTQKDVFEQEYFFN